MDQLSPMAICKNSAEHKKLRSLKKKAIDWVEIK